MPRKGKQEYVSSKVGLRVQGVRVEAPPTETDQGSMRGRVALTLALKFAAEHPEAAGCERGPDLFKRVLGAMERR